MEENQVIWETEGAFETKVMSLRLPIKIKPDKSPPYNRDYTDADEKAYNYAGNDDEENKKALNFKNTKIIDKARRKKPCPHNGCKESKGSVCK
jgi:hypothetical protein